MPREDIKVARHYEKPPYNMRRRKCEVCHKSLSMYNLDKYCFIHRLNGAKLERQIRADNVQKLAKRDQEKRKKERSDNKRRHRNNGT